MNQNKIVLQNAKTQLEAQKQKIFNDAYAVKTAQLKADVDAFITLKTNEYNVSISKLKKAYDDAIAEKKKEFDNEIAEKKKSVDELATVYAGQQTSITQNLIFEIESLIAKVED